MSKKKHLHLLSTLSLLVCATSASAAAPVYFDLGGLVKYGLFWVIVLVALPIFASKANSQREIRGYWIAFLAVFSLPILLIGYVALEKEMNSQQRTAHLKSEAKANADLCLGDLKVTRTVSAVRGIEGIALSIRVANPSGSAMRQFAHELVYDLNRRFVLHPDLCAHSRIRSIEYALSLTDLSLNPALPGQYITHAMCPRGEVKIHEGASIASYEIVLGEIIGRPPMSKGALDKDTSRFSVSMRIVDRTSGALVASDTLYATAWLPPDTKEHCPLAADRVAEVIERSFPK